MKKSLTLMATLIAAMSLCANAQEQKTGVSKKTTSKEVKIAALVTGTTAVAAVIFSRFETTKRVSDFCYGATLGLLWGTVESLIMGPNHVPFSITRSKI